MSEPTVDEVMGAIAWSSDQYESLKKIILALSKLAQDKGATEQEVATVAAEAIGYTRIK